MNTSDDKTITGVMQRFGDTSTVKKKKTAGKISQDKLLL